MRKTVKGTITRLLLFLSAGLLFSGVSDAGENNNSAKKVLITGFAPFGGEKINPSYEAVKLLPDKIGGAEIYKRELPVVFVESINEIKKLIKEINPDIVICVGQAGGRSSISLERIAINVDDARIPDNKGNKPVDEKIFKDGDDGYFSTLPIKVIVKNIKDAKIPADVSNSAGTFVCNHIMYGLLYTLKKEYPGKTGGFIHVPYIPSQVEGKNNTPSLPLADMEKALEIAIKTSLDHNKDLKISAGKEH